VFAAPVGFGFAGLMTGLITMSWRAPGPSRALGGLIHRVLMVF
jgi:hypothetical protein